MICDPHSMSENPAANISAESTTSHNLISTAGEMSESVNCLILALFCFDVFFLPCYKILLATIASHTSAVDMGMDINIDTLGKMVGGKFVSIYSIYFKYFS